MILKVKIITVDIKILSILSRMPPCPGMILEKSFKEYVLLIKEKNKSPKKSEEAIKKHSTKLKLKIWRTMKLIIKEDSVPDQVLFGLKLGVIKGPLKDFPTI